MKNKTYAQTCSPSLTSIFDNLVNGNLADAKLKAKKHSTFRLSMFANQILFWSFEKSVAAAAYLKGESSFQNYCDHCTAARHRVRELKGERFLENYYESK